MRRLMLLRHAKSDWPSAGVRDRERPLNRRGRDAAPKMGAYIARAGLIPERVVCSTAKRARETCELVLDALPKRVAVTPEDRLYNAGQDSILDVIRTTPRDAHSLLVVGHNPGVHEMALALVASGDDLARERLQEKFPTAALAVIDFAVDDWGEVKRRLGRLDRFITPRQLGAED
jgi:phosphohistidine phosphatase